MPFEQHIPRPFNARGVQMFSPAASGIYGISNARQWLYIGESEDIQAALLSHLQDASGSMMRMVPTGFVYEVCNGGRRPSRQDRLVQEYGPILNRQAER